MGNIIAFIAICGYIFNAVVVISKPEYRTLNVSNSVCGIGIFVPPVGSLCGVVRFFD